MKLLLVLGEESLGYAEAEDALTDPPMGCGDVLFRPSEGYTKVADLFRRRSLCLGALGDQDAAELEIVDGELSEMNLVLIAENGEPLSIAGFSISDYGPEFPEAGLRLEFLGMHHEQFERLFPGHYAKYEAVCAAKA